MRKKRFHIFSVFKRSVAIFLNPFFFPFQIPIRRAHFSFYTEIREEEERERERENGERKKEREREEGEWREKEREREREEGDRDERERRESDKLLTM